MANSRTTLQTLWKNSLAFLTNNDDTNVDHDRESSSSSSTSSIFKSNTPTVKALAKIQLNPKTAGTDNHNHENINTPLRRPHVNSIQQSSTKTSLDNDGQDLQNLNTLAKLRCWSAIEQCATTVDSIHHVTLTTPVGNAPLHTAISNGAPLSTIQALVIANPPSVAVGNKFGNTPLHFAAWKNKYTESFPIVEFLLQYHPQSVQRKNTHGNLPLHHATNYKAHPDIVQALYRAYPKAISIPNDKGKTPLDLAIHRLGEQHRIVTMLQGKTAYNYVYHQGTTGSTSNSGTSNSGNIGGGPRSIQNKKMSTTATIPTTTDMDKNNDNVNDDDYDGMSTTIKTKRRITVNNEGRYSTVKEDLVEITTDTWHEVDL